MPYTHTLSFRIGSKRWQGLLHGYKLSKNRNGSYFCLPMGSGALNWAVPKKARAIGIQRGNYHNILHVGVLYKSMINLMTSADFL